MFKANRNSQQQRERRRRESNAGCKHAFVCVCVFVFPTRFLICSISPRFFSMHCRFRFRGAEKMHHACRSKVCWILNTAELWGDE